MERAAELRRVHDVGGLAGGPIERAAHGYAPWEKRVDAMVFLLASQEPAVLSMDELRRAIEELGAGAYDRLGYYERWLTALTRILLEKGVITVHELGRKMAEVEVRAEVTT